MNIWDYYYNERMRLDPLLATRLGHEGYDGAINIFSSAYRDAASALRETCRSQIAKSPPMDSEETTFFIDHLDECDKLDAVWYIGIMNPSDNFVVDAVETMIHHQPLKNDANTFNDRAVAVVEALRGFSDDLVIASKFYAFPKAVVDAFIMSVENLLAEAPWKGHKHMKAMETHIVPILRHVVDTARERVLCRQSSHGICDARYNTFLVHYTSLHDLTANEVHSLGKREVKRLQQLLTTLPAADSVLKRGEVLAAYRKTIARIARETIPEEFGKIDMPSPKVSAIEASRTTYATGDLRRRRTDKYERSSLKQRVCSHRSRGHPWPSSKR